MKGMGTLIAALAVTLGAAQGAHANDEMVTLTGCVQGFAQGGYFFSDVVDGKGKVKHYLLVNANDEVKQYEGQMITVVGQRAPFGWSVKIKTADNRTLKTSSVFGVDTIERASPTCEPAAQMASAGR